MFRRKIQNVSINSYPNSYECELVKTMTGLVPIYLICIYLSEVKLIIHDIQNCNTKKVYFFCGYF